MDYQFNLDSEFTIGYAYNTLTNNMGKKHTNGGNKRITIKSEIE